MSDRHQLREKINKLVRRIGIPTVCLQHGLGIVDSHYSNYQGVYTGALASPELKAYVDLSDFILSLCPLFSDTGTAGRSAMANLQSTVRLSVRECKWANNVYHISVDDFFEKLLKDPRIDNLKQRQCPDLPKQFAPLYEQPTVESLSPITQDYLWPPMSSFFRSGDTVLLANGIPLIGSKLFRLPPKVWVIASGLWYSVGHILPAAQGAALILKDRPRDDELSDRTILLEGDGSFQATAQELSTIVRYKLGCTIFIVNNERYAYERLIDGLREDYNEVAPWTCTLAPRMVGAMDTVDYPVQAYTAQNMGELDEILFNGTVKSAKGLTLVEIKMGQEDVPRLFSRSLGQRRRATETVLDMQ